MCSGGPELQGPYESEYPCRKSAVAGYRIEVRLSAVKELEALPQRDLARITARIEALAETPRPPGSEKLSGQERFRLRQGDCRILYEVNDRRQAVTIVKVGHRREIYR